LREAANRAAQGELPKERLWLFRDARWRCLEASEADLQPEALKLDEHDVAPHAASQIEWLDPTQLAVWVSGAPDPQRTALALFYLDEFDYNEILDLAELKLSELSRYLIQGRGQLQAWLDAKHPQQGTA
jgi:DNA-directed RNA polymerase specialized sigma24 family protein